MRTVQHTFIIAALTLAASVPVFAADAPKGDAQKPILQALADKKGGDCLFTRTISDWQAIDNEHVLVWAPTNHQAYLATLWRPGFALKSEFTLGFEDHNRDGMICDYGGDSIVVGGPLHDRIQIQSLSRLSETEVQQLQAEMKGKKEHPVVHQPEQSDMKSDKPGATASRPPH